MNPSICIHRISYKYSEYMVVCALVRMTGTHMVDKIVVYKEQDKKGIPYQKMLVDFKQDIVTESSKKFFMDIQEGKNVLSYDNRDFWKTHFIPFGIVKELKNEKKIQQDFLHGEGGGIFVPEENIKTTKEIVYPFRYRKREGRSACALP